MKGFVTTKKRIGTITFALMLVFAVFGAAMVRADTVNKQAQLPQNAQNEQQRVSFIQKLGYTVDTGVAEEKKEIVVPFTFSGVYKTYNDIQKQAGYDLMRFCGKKVTVYTYKLSDKVRDDVYAHIITYDNSLIGGDIAAISVEDGYMLPLN